MKPTRRTSGRGKSSGELSFAFGAGARVWACAESNLSEEMFVRLLLYRAGVKSQRLLCSFGL